MARLLGVAFYLLAARALALQPGDTLTNKAYLHYTGLPEPIESTVDVTIAAATSNSPSLTLLSEDNTGTAWPVAAGCHPPAGIKPASASPGNYNPPVFPGTVTASPAKAYAVGDPVLVSVIDAAANASPTLPDKVQVTVTSPTGDSEQIVLTETGVDTGVFVGYVYTTSLATAANDCALSVASNSTLTATYTPAGAGAVTLTRTVSVAPVSRVFNEATGRPVNGIVLTLVNADTGTPAEVYGNGPTYATYPASVETGHAVDDRAGLSYPVGPGQYRFPAVPEGDYRIEIFNPEGYAVSSLNNASRGAPFHLAQGAVPKIDISLQPVTRQGNQPPSASKIQFLQYSDQPGVGTAYNVQPTECVGGQQSRVTGLRNTHIPVPGVVNLAPADAIMAGEPVFVEVNDPDQNQNPDVRDTVTVQLNVPVTGDTEWLKLTETEPDSGIFIGDIQTEQGDNTSVGNCSLDVEVNSEIRTVYTDAFNHVDTSESTILVDPYGKVFSSFDGSPVSGVTVTLINDDTGQPAKVYGDGPAFAPFPNPVVTGETATDAAGRHYAFPSGDYRFPFVMPGHYHLALSTVPHDYEFPSTASDAALEQLPGAPYALGPGSRGGQFIVPLGPAVHLDVPLDRRNGMVFVSKRASKQTAAIGDFVQFAVTVQNRSTNTLSKATLQDTLPKGFRYRNGSLEINGKKSGDPDIGADGRSLSITLPDIGDAPISISYVTEITAGAEPGEDVNSATVTGPLVSSSNVAKAGVMVTDDLFREKAILTGRVTLSGCGGDNAQAKGLPGVRLFLEDGTNVTTDKNGLWHIDGVTPGTHVVQLDMDSLPKRYQVSPCNRNSRFAGSPYSQFVDVQGGTVWRADFRVQQRPDPRSTLTLTQSAKIDDGHLDVTIVASNRGSVAVDNADIIYNAPSGWRIVAGSERLDGKVAVHADTIVGDLWRLGALSGKRQLTFQLAAPTPEAITALRLKGDATARLAFHSAGTPKGMTRVDRLPLGQLVGGFNVVSTTVTGKAVGSWDLVTNNGTRPLPPRSPNVEGLINIANGQRLSRRISAVKLDLDSRLTPRLSLDGVEIPPSRIGFKMEERKTGKTLYSYIGVDFGKPGKHTLRLQGLDHFGNARFDERVHVVRVGDLYRIKVLDTKGNIADGNTPVKVKLALLDRAGERIDVPYKLVLSGGDLHRYDKNMTLSQLTKITDNDYVQVNGDGVLEFNPVSHSGVYRAKLKYGDHHETDLEVFVEPEKRSWIMVGLAEGTAAYNALRGNMRSLADAGKSDVYDAKGRIAFYAKGEVKGQYILTAAYDTHKARPTALGQSIDPNSYYTLYGDGTAAQHDAQSQSKLYLKLEKNQFYALFGDYSTGLTVTELSQYSRRFNGLKTEYEGDKVKVNAFASQADQAFVKDEIRGDGTSGVYHLSSRNIVADSETITIQTRDRFHSQKIISQKQLQRYVDYDIDYDNGTVFFKEPIYSQDDAFNPVYIVADYETEGDGKNRLNAGGRIAYKLKDNSAVGVTLIKQGVMNRESQLAGADVHYQVNAGTEVKAEVATTHSKQDGVETNGSAYLAEVTTQTGKLDGQAYIRQQGAGFGLGQQNASESGTRKIGAAASYKVNDKMKVRGEAYRQTSLTSGENEDVAAATVNYQGRIYQLNSGLRSARSNGAGGQVSNQVTAGASRQMLGGRLNLTSQLDAPIGGRNGEPNFPKKLRVGLDYKLTRNIALKAEQEFTWGGQQGTQGTRIGLSSKLWKGAEVSSQVQQTSQENVQRLAAVTGLKQSWDVNPHWRLDFGMDRSHTLRQRGVPPLTVTTVYSTPGSDDFTSVTFGSQFRKDAWDWSTRVEYRTAATEAKVNVLSDVIHDLAQGEQLLAKIAIERDNTTDADTMSTNVQLGYAYRPAAGRWTVLNRLDLTHQRSQTPLFDTQTQKIVNNLNANYLLSPRTQVSLQYGLKYVVDNFDTSQYQGFTDLYGLQLRHDVTDRVDIGAQASIYSSHGVGVSNRSWGFSVGYNLAHNTWVSVGYNFTGFRDSDFSASDYTAKGVFLKYRFKFDQNTFRQLQP